MNFVIRLTAIVLALAYANAPGRADPSPAINPTIRVASWNISDDAFVAEPQEFQSLLRWADADVVLLDEVSPSADTDRLITVLDKLHADSDETWHLNVGASGGRQRGVIASLDGQETLPEFSSVVPYPEVERREILKRMSEEARSNPGWSMDGGIPVNGAVILTGGGRLLVVVADLQCCGDGPNSWQEYRRRVEAREIRRLIRQILERTQVDGVVFAGDFNMVTSTFPMTILAGPYPLPHAGLIPAELYHPDGSATWTWDGRKTPFPSNTLDYQFYGPQGLTMRSGVILDTEGLTSETRRSFGLEDSTSSRTGRHRPLVAEYVWN